MMLRVGWVEEPRLDRLCASVLLEYYFLILEFWETWCWLELRLLIVWQCAWCWSGLLVDDDGPFLLLEKAGWWYWKLLLMWSWKYRACRSRLYRLLWFSTVMSCYDNSWSLGNTLILISLLSFETNPVMATIEARVIDSHPPDYSVDQSMRHWSVTIDSWACVRLSAFFTICRAVLRKTWLVVPEVIVRSVTKTVPSLLASLSVNQWKLHFAELPYVLVFNTAPVIFSVIIYLLTNDLHKIQGSDPRAALAGHFLAFSHLLSVLPCYDSSTL